MNKDIFELSDKIFDKIKASIIFDLFERPFNPEDNELSYLNNLNIININELKQEIELQLAEDGTEIKQNTNNQVTNFSLTNKKLGLVNNYTLNNSNISNTNVTCNNTSTNNTNTNKIADKKSKVSNSFNSTCIGVKNINSNNEKTDKNDKESVTMSESNKTLTSKSNTKELKNKENNFSRKKSEKYDKTERSNSSVYAHKDSENSDKDKDRLKVQPLNSFQLNNLLKNTYNSLHESNPTKNKIIEEGKENCLIGNKNISNNENTCFKLLSQTQVAVTHGISKESIESDITQSSDFDKELFYLNRIKQGKLEFDFLGQKSASSISSVGYNNSNLTDSNNNTNTVMKLNNGITSTYINLLRTKDTKPIFTQFPNKEFLQRRVLSQLYKVLSRLGSKLLSEYEIKLAALEIETQARSKDETMGEIYKRWISKIFSLIKEEILDSSSHSHIMS
jgi:hypothetical protein